MRASSGLDQGEIRIQERYLLTYNLHVTAVTLDSKQARTCRTGKVSSTAPCLKGDRFVKL
jgi:hypothetical protein